MSRLLSLVITAIYLILAGSQGARQVGSLCAALVIPLLLIWFPDEIGSFTGWRNHGSEVKETPASWVSAAGWTFLIGLPLLCLWK